MGGCKCSYVSCSKTTDGKTHFFHFPVKDPARCQQWIINSNRSDFNMFRTTQLKNKVVCEKHFPENMFMNYKHERLIHTAVPMKEIGNDGSEQINRNVSISDENVEDPPKILPNSVPKDINIKNLDANSNKKDKEMSTLAVNVSPITGLSFFSPHEKKSNSAPYIEILTRLHHNKPVPCIVNTPKPTPTTVIQNKSSVLREQMKTSNNNNLKKDLVFERVEPEKSAPPIETPVFVAPSNVNTKPDNAQTFMKLKRKPIYMRNLPIKTENSPTAQKIVRKYTNVLNKSPSLPVDNKNGMQHVPDFTGRNVEMVIDNEITLNPVPNQMPIEEIQPSFDMEVIEKSLINKPIDGVGNLQENDIIILPMDSDVQNKISLYNICTENTSQTHVDQNNMIYTNLVNESTRMLNEMKTIQGNIETLNTAREKVERRRPIPKRVVKTRNFHPLSKASLYAQIVPFLSPELAKQVHMEMFPSLRRMHRNC